jgi:hypothetical protein
MHVIHGAANSTGAATRRVKCTVNVIPGADPLIVECLPGSSLVDELTEAGYQLTSIGEAERIMPDGVSKSSG